MVWDTVRPAQANRREREGWRFEMREVVIRRPAYEGRIIRWANHNLCYGPTLSSVVQSGTRIDTCAVNRLETYSTDGGGIASCCRQRGITLGSSTSWKLVATLWSGLSACWELMGLVERRLIDAACWLSHAMRDHVVLSGTRFHTCAVNRVETYSTDGRWSASCCRERGITLGSSTSWKLVATLWSGLSACWELMGLVERSLIEAACWLSHATRDRVVLSGTRFHTCAVNRLETYSTDGGGIASCCWQRGITLGSSTSWKFVATSWRMNAGEQPTPLPAPPSGVQSGAERRP